MDVPDDEPVWAEEVFGPVVAVRSVPDVETAFALVNASRYGFARERLHRLAGDGDGGARHPEVGGVVVNEVPGFRPMSCRMAASRTRDRARRPRFAIEELTVTRMAVIAPSPRGSDVRQRADDRHADDRQRARPDSLDVARRRSGYGRLFRLDGRRVLVVGAAGGIGREVAPGLAAQGASVVCADKDPAGPTRPPGSSRRPGSSSPRGSPTRGRAPPRHTRWTSSDPAALGRAAEELGALDGLVLMPATNVRKRLLDYTGEEFDRVVSLNLRAAFDLVRAFAPGMVARGRGASWPSARSVRSPSSPVRVCMPRPRRGWSSSFGPPLRSLGRTASGSTRSRRGSSTRP